MTKPLWIVLGVIAFSASSARGQTAPGTRAWYERAIVGMEVGPTGAQFGHSDPADTRYAARFNGAEIVRACLEAHGEYVVIWARDGDYAYYNSKLLPRAPGLKDRDPLKDAVATARPRHMPVIAYCVVQQGGHFLKAHPEWEMRGPDGKPLGRFCLRSGYLEAMKAIMAEQLAYGIDGFHVDMLDQSFGPPIGCYCDTCQKQFQAEYRHPMPKEARWDEPWRDMLAFRYQSSQKFEKALAAAIKQANPAASVDFNYHGNPPFSYEVGQRPVQHAGNGDFVTGETGVWGFSALGVGFNAEFYRASTPGHPFQVAMQRGVRMYHDQTTRPLADLRWELFTLLAHGAFVTVVDKTGFDGGLDVQTYERIAAMFEDARTLREHLGQAPHFEAGLYYSSKSRDWIGRAHAPDWMQGILGAHKALVYEHIPFGIVLDENASRAALRAFPVLILPQVGILSETELALLSDYVREGGKLIITGQSGQYDALGRPAVNPAFERLVGARVKGRLDSLDNWMCFGASVPGVFRGGIRPDWPFLVKGPATLYEAASAQAIGELLRPWRTTRQKEGREGTEWPMSAEAPVGPAVLLNTIGKGQVLTFAGSPDHATASEHHIVEARRLIAHAVRLLNPRPTITIQAPTFCEAVTSHDPSTRTVRVHLLAYASPPQSMPARNRPFVLPTPIEDSPIYRVRIELDRPIQSARAVRDQSTVKTLDRRVEATIEGIHEILVITY